MVLCPFVLEESWMSLRRYACCRFMKAAVAGGVNPMVKNFEGVAVTSQFFTWYRWVKTKEISTVTRRHAIPEWWECKETNWLTLCLSVNIVGTNADESRISTGMCICNILCVDFMPPGPWWGKNHGKKKGRCLLSVERYLFRASSSRLSRRTFPPLTFLLLNRLVHSRPV